MIRYLILAILLLCSGCIQLGNDSQPSRYYLLTPMDATVTDPVANPAILKLAPLKLPPYLDRPQIVTRSRANEIVIAEFDRWGEPLRDNLRRVIEENLLLQFKTITLDNQSWSTGKSEEAKLFITINQFDGTLGQQARVDIRWELIDSKDNHQRGHFVAEQPIGRDYSELVRELNNALNQFSIKLAQDLTKQL